MAGISTSIELQDHFSSILNNVCNAVNLAISSMADMQSTMAAGVDTSSLESAREQINLATLALHEMNDAMRDTDSPPAPPTPPTPPAPPAPPQQWQADSLSVFDGSGMERFRQEAQSAQAMLLQLCRTQDAIARQALHTDVLPSDAFQDINRLATRMDSLRNRIQAISENPVNMGTEEANRQLEQLRAQLNRAVQQQEELNGAMASGDISAINEAYLRLSQTVGNTERYIRDNTAEQGRFNQQIRDGTSASNDLLNSLKGIAAAYISIQAIDGVIGFSDELAQTMSRLNLMNDGAQTTAELFDKIYASAKDTHSQVMATADAIAKMGNNAGSAFSNNDELIAFMEQVNKQFIIGGASAQEQSNALLQLSQAMSAGALRGDELNSILDAAPGIARAIEQSMGWAEGSIKSYAEEGAVTAEVVKSSLLNMADETNAAFESMPVTFSQIMTDIQDDAVVAFQPVMQSLNELANSEAFNSFVDTVIGGITTIANSESLQTFIGKVEQMFNTLNNSGAFQGVVDGVVIALEMLVNVATVAVDLLGSAAGFIADNWSVIAPIIGGVVAILGVYALQLGIIKGIEIASAVASGAMAIAKGIQATAIWLTTTATWAETTAQLGLNGAMYACPVVWIVAMLIALVAVIIAVANHIAKTSEVANTGFSVITGGINVVIQFFKNLGLTAANISAGITLATLALAYDMMAAFHNAFCNIKKWFYGLLSTAMTVIAGICEALNKLPFISFDYSGITSAADDYAAKAAAAEGNKWEYKSIGDAFNKGMSTYDTFQDG